MSNQPPPIPPQPLSYSTPASYAFQPGQAAPMMRDGNLLITPPHVTLPHQCIICGKDPAKRYQKTLYWSSPLWALTILIGVLIYLIIVLIVRKSGVVNFGLCEEHVARRKRGILIMSVLVTLSILMLIVLPIAAVGLAEENIIPKSMGATLAILGVVFAFTSLIVLIVMSNRIVPGLRARYIDNYMMKLHGCGQPFLESLPPFSSKQGYVAMAQGYAQ